MHGKPSGKFKFVMGEPTYKNQFYSDLVLPIQSVEGHQCVGNGKYSVFPWKGGGGTFTVRGATELGKVPNAGTPLVKGHSGPIMDMDFSPFHDNMLATASGDTTLRLWQMPEIPMKTSTDQSAAILRGHSKKVMLMKWHPSAEFTLASAGLNGGVRIWDVQLERTTFSYQGNTANPWSMDWNYDGSMVGLLTKEKKMHIIDPRSEKSVHVGTAHESSKAQRVKWNGKHQKMITVGYSEYNERQYMVWDPRDWSKPLTCTQMDSNSQVMFSHYDDITNLFWVVNKGSNFTQMFYFSEQGERGSLPELVPLGTYNGKEGTIYFYMQSKQSVDPIRKEITRGMRLTKNACELITFKLPRKEEEFSKDLFPPHRSQTAALTYEEWSKGTNKEPILEEFDPAHLDKLLEARQSQIAATFKKKEGAGFIQEKSAEANPAANAKEMLQLQDDLKKHQQTIKQNEETIKGLQSQLGLDGPPEALAKPVLGYFDIRGQGQAIRYLLAHAGIDYDEKLYTQEQLGGSLPKMPYWKEKTGQTVGSTLDILKHIATTHKPDLAGQSDADKSVIDMMSKVCVDLGTALCEPCYANDQNANYEDIIKTKASALINSLKLSPGSFILGEHLCYLDFFIYELTQQMDFLTYGSVYTNHEELSAHNTAMQEQLSAYLGSNPQSLAEFPFFHRFTSINNWPQVNWKQQAQE